MPNWKKVIVSGSDAVLNSVTASFTGSLTGTLIGTASWATNALTASFATNGGVTQLLAGPNITLSPIDGKGQVTVSATLSGSTSFNTSTGSYGSFYDTTTQTNPVGNVPRSMSFDSTDITNGVSISGSTNPFNTYIKTTNAGVYNIQFSAQIDKTDSGADEIVIWLRKNGIDLTDTATTLTLSGNNDKKVAAWNWFVNSAANDYYQIIWYSADTDLRLLAEVAGGGHPGIPSVILTANRVDQFLSNTGSFSGSFTGAFTGSLFGTASWAQSASNAIIAIDAISANSAKTIATISSSVNAVFYPTFVDSNNTPSANESLFTSNVITFNPGGQVLTVRTLSAENIQITNSLNVTGSATFVGGITGSLLGTASFATSASQAISSSRATSASYALSASYAPPSSPFPFTGSALITGSLGVIGSTSIQGTLNQGSASLASGLFSHVQGFANTASGIYSHAEGQSNIAIGDASHAEGQLTTANGPYSHAEGYGTITNGFASHTEGQSNVATGQASHAEGLGTTANGSFSHAEGYGTLTTGDYSHAEGLSTVALGNYQHVQGQYNLSLSAQSAFIIGNGVDASNRSNLVFASGSQFQITGSLKVSDSITYGTSASQALTTTTRVTANSGITTIYSVATGSYDGAFFDYVIRSGSNARAGQIMGLWSGSSVNFTETTTTDFGSTSNFILGMSISASNMILSSSTTSNGWIVKAIVRSI